MRRGYRELNEEELETTINVLYSERIISIYSNKKSIERQLRKVLGKANREDVRGNAILGSRWDISFDDKSKISQMMLKANIFEL